MIVLRAVGIPRWVGWTGLILAAAVAASLPTGTALGNDLLAGIGVTVYTVWYLWLILLGVVLLLRHSAPGAAPATP